MPNACCCVVLTAIKEFNNALKWLVRAMPAIGLEFVEGVGLRLVQLPGILLNGKMAKDPNV